MVSWIFTKGKGLLYLIRHKNLEFCVAKLGFLIFDSFSLLGWFSKCDFRIPHEISRRHRWSKKIFSEHFSKFFSVEKSPKIFSNPYRIQQIQVKVPRFHKSNQTCASSSPGWLCRITSSFLHIKIIYLVSMKKIVSRLGSVWALRELSWTFFRAKSAGNHFPPTRRARCFSPNTNIVNDHPKKQNAQEVCNKNTCLYYSFSTVHFCTPEFATTR